MHTPPSGSGHHPAHDVALLAHLTLTLFTLEDQNDTAPNPNKARRVSDDVNPAFPLPKNRLKVLASPSDRTARRRSSLPSSLQADDVFQGPAREHNPFRPVPPPRSHSRTHHRPASPSPVTVVPLAESDFDEEEGEIREKLTDATPRPPRSTSREHTPHSDIDMATAGDELMPTTGFPTADAFKAAPATEQDDNPHRKLPAFEPSGPEDTAIVASSKFQANTGEWDDAVIAYAKLIENLSDAAVQGMEKDPGRHLILLPFLGGKFFHSNYSAAAAEIRAALIDVVGPNGLTIAVPSPKSLAHGERDDKYGAPMIMIARAASVDIHDRVARLPLIPISKSLAVRVYTIDQAKAARTWSAGFFHCNIAGDDKDLRESLRWAVAQALWSAPALRQLVVRATQPGATLSADARVLAVARTVTARYIDHATDPFWVVYLKPCTTDYALWEEIRSAIRNTAFEDGIACFEPLGKKPPRGMSRPAWICHVCKCDDHLAYVCPFCAALDWWGPSEVINARTEGPLAIPKKQKNNNNGRGRGGNRSNAGSGGNSGRNARQNHA
ncbi:hypothetical protein B0H15DRAFT_945312 [Mycena belliarum]|uniref:Uncharacterized protein n=1 Tax=Mycena belliarum TaxID=1033014 RepID=A0AAD6UDI0_9AGAR|nr:hypothetical protein B0H15DRAFT_945312 [Mycena belliae]